MNILFLSDIDGTLLEGHSIDPEVKRAIAEFIEQGNYFSLATGRNVFAIKWIIDELKINAPCVVLTGAALFDPLCGTLSNVKPLAAEARDLLAKVLTDYPDIGIQVFTRDGLRNLRFNPFLQEHGIAEEVGLGVSDINKLNGVEILKIGLCCEDTGRLEQAIALLFSDEAKYKWHYSFRISVEIFSPEVSKGIAMRSLIDSLPSRPTYVAAAGDSPNDLSMFSEADITFAPESAFPEVAAAASHIIPPPSRAGIVRALEMLMTTEKQT